MNKEIIEAAKNGEEWALTELYNNTYNSIYYTVRVLIKDENEVYDIIQDSYIKAFRSLDQLNDPANFKAWMKKISTNKAKDYLKKRKLINFSQLEDENGDLEIDFEDERIEFNPAVAVDKEETKRLLWGIIDSLTDEQRLVIDMFYFQEMTIKEISETVDCSENTIKSRLNYGRKNIEVKVKELEKKGTKLYGLAPLPFLLFLLQTTEAQAAEAPASAMLESIINSSQPLNAAGMGTSVGKEITGGITKTITSKVIVGILAGVVVVGGITGYVVANNNKNNHQAVTEREETETNEIESLKTEAEEDIKSGVYIQNIDFYMRVNIEKLSDTTANVIIQDTYNDRNIIWEGEATVDPEEKVLTTIVENENLLDLEEGEKTIKITLLHNETIQVEASEKLQSVCNAVMEGTYEKAENIIETEQPLYLQESNITDSRQIKSGEYYGDNYIILITSIIDSPVSSNDIQYVPSIYQGNICRVTILYNDTLEEQMSSTVFYYSEEEGAYRSPIYPVAFNFDKNDLNLQLLEYETPENDNMSGIYNGVVNTVDLNRFTDSFEEIDLTKYNGLGYYDDNGDLRYSLDTSDGNLILLCQFLTSTDQSGVWAEYPYKINYDTNNILSILCEGEDITYKFNDMRFVFLEDIVILEVEANYNYNAGGYASYLDTGVYILKNN